MKGFSFDFFIYFLERLTGEIKALKEYLECKGIINV